MDVKEVQVSHFPQNHVSHNIWKIKISDYFYPKSSTYVDPANTCKNHFEKPFGDQALITRIQAYEKEKFLHIAHWVKVLIIATLKKTSSKDST